jgi:hypothetical protein
MKKKDRSKRKSVKRQSQKRTIERRICAESPEKTYSSLVEFTQMIEKFAAEDDSMASSYRKSSENSKIVASLSAVFAFTVFVYCNWNQTNEIHQSLGNMLSGFLGTFAIYSVLCYFSKKEVQRDWEGFYREHLTYLQDLYQRIEVQKNLGLTA